MAVVECKVSPGRHCPVASCIWELVMPGLWLSNGRHRMQGRSIGQQPLARTKLRTSHSCLHAASLEGTPQGNIRQQMPSQGSNTSTRLFETPVKNMAISGISPQWREAHLEPLDSQLPELLRLGQGHLPKGALCDGAQHLDSLPRHVGHRAEHRLQVGQRLVQLCLLVEPPCTQPGSEPAAWDQDAPGMVWVESERRVLLDVM